MRRSGHQRNAYPGTVLTEPKPAAPHQVCTTSADCDTGPVATAELPETHVLLLPSGTFVETSNSNAQTLLARRRHLAVAIRQRIESRLAGRVRDLAIRIVGKTVVLEGKCSTYYTKQLAQHAALGILEDEQLENSIVVAVQRRS